MGVQRVVADEDSDHRDLGQRIRKARDTHQAPGRAAVATMAAPTAALTHSFIPQIVTEHVSGPGTEGDPYDVLITLGHVVTLQG